MDTAVQKALEKDTLVDITTVGRRTGRLHRKEVGFHYLEGRLFISGRPGRRDWYANLQANPNFTFHLKQSLTREVKARAMPITDKVQRQEVFSKMLALENRIRHLDILEWTARSPLVEVELLD